MTTVTLAAHAHQGLILYIYWSILNANMFFSALSMHGSSSMWQITIECLCKAVIQLPHYFPYWGLTNRKGRKNKLQLRIPNHNEKHFTVHNPHHLFIMLSMISQHHSNLSALFLTLAQIQTDQQALWRLLARLPASYTAWMVCNKEHSVIVRKLLINARSHWLPADYNTLRH